MLNIAQIKKLISKGENETVEFKTSFSKDVSETLAAMANRQGGVVLVGVSDKKEIVGVQLGGESLQKWLNEIGQVTEPRLIPDVQQYEINKKSVVCFEISPYPIKPVSCNGKNYLRIANSNKVLSSREIAELHLQSVHSSWDSIVSSKKDNEINLNFVKSYISRIRQSGRRDLKGIKDWKAIFRKLELIKSDKLTWACFLLFKKNESALPASIVRVVRVKGDAQIVDDNFIEGALINQVEEIIKAIQKNLKLSYQITGRANRDEIWEYPLDAIREAVINAICHRDYTHNGDILIKIYDEKMSVWSPGKLPPNLTIDQLLKDEHASNPRNKMITQAFYDVAQVERLGSGIQRIMGAFRDRGLPKPTFTEEADGFKVVFKNGGIEDHANLVNKTLLTSVDRQGKALQFAQKEGRITNSDYQRINEVSHRSAAREIAQLVKDKFLKRVGTTGKGTYYVLTKKYK